MKKLCSVLTATILCSAIGIAQTQWGKVIDIPFGSGENQLSLRAEQLQQAKIALGSFPDPRDILIGSDGSFYIPDVNNWRILVYDKEGRLSGTITVPRKDPTSVQLGSRSMLVGYRMFLAEDWGGRLYVHMTSMENRLFALYRFDNDRKHVFEFPFSDKKPGSGDLVGSIYAGRRGYVYIPSYPAETIRANWENTVYKYDSSGHFVAMVDYYFEDKLGNVYKPWMSKVGKRYHWELNKFKSPQTPTATSKTLGKTGSFSVPTQITDDSTINVQNFIFCGFDSNMAIYVTDGKVTKVFNQSLKFVRDIPTRIDDLEKTMGIISEPQNIRVAPDGGIYMFGLKTPHGRQESFCSPSDAIFVVMKFK